MKTWVVPVALIILVLAGGFIVWMTEGAPTQPTIAGYSSGPYLGGASQGASENRVVPPPPPATTTPASQGSVYPVVSSTSPWVAFNTPFILSIGQARYVGENASSNIQVTLRSIVQPEGTAVIVESYCPLAGCEMNPEQPSTFALSLNSPQTFSGYAYTLTAIANTAATIVVARASE